MDDTRSSRLEAVASGEGEDPRADASLDPRRSGASRLVASMSDTRRRSPRSTTPATLDLLVVVSSYPDRLASAYLKKTSGLRRGTSGVGPLRLSRQIAYSSLVRGLYRARSRRAGLRCSLWLLKGGTGSGIGAISQLLSSHAPAFADFELPSSDPAANALHILSLIKCGSLRRLYSPYPLQVIRYLACPSWCGPSALMSLFDSFRPQITSPSVLQPTPPAPFDIRTGPRHIGRVGSLLQDPLRYPSHTREPRPCVRRGRLAGVGIMARYGRRGLRLQSVRRHPFSPNQLTDGGRIEPGGPQIDVGAGLHARAMPVSHGSLAAGTYQSSAFFISIEGSDRQLLFFGDVEPGGSGRPAASFRLTLPA